MRAAHTSCFHALKSLKPRFPHTVVVGGNHDGALDDRCDSHDADIHDDLEARAECREVFYRASSIDYLKNNDIEIRVRGRTLRIWGSPGSLSTTPQSCFGYAPGRDAQDLWAQIPSNTDILITHGPPLGYMDQDGLGCGELMKALWRVRPLVHIFGYLHKGHGELILRYDELQKQYEAAIWDWNTAVIEDQKEASEKTAKYIPQHLHLTRRSPFPKLPDEMNSVTHRMWNNQETLLVNASIKGVPPFDPIVIEV